MAKYKDSQGNVYEIGSPELNPDLIKGKTQVADSTPLTAGAPVITVDELNKPISPITLPEVKQDTTDYATLVAGLVPPPSEETPVEDTSKRLLQKIALDMGELSGKTAYTQEQNKLFGVTDMTKKQKSLTAKLNALNTKAQKLESDYSIVPEKIQEQYAGTGATRGGVAPITASEQRKILLQRQTLASDALAIKAEYDMNEGDLENAKFEAQQAIDLKYKDKELELENNTKFLQLLTPFMTAEQKERADKKQLENEAKKTELADKKKLQTDVVNYAQEQQDGITASQVMALDPNSSTFGADLARLQGQVKVKTNTLDDQYKKLQIQKMQKDISGGGTSEDLAEVDSWTKLILTGQAKITDVKSGPLRDAVARAVKESGQLVLSDKDREKLSVLDTADNVLNTIREYSQQVNTSGALGRATGAPFKFLGKVFQTNDIVSAFDAARNGFVANVARTLGEKGALSEGDVSRAINNLPTIYDTQAVAQRKLKTLEDVLSKARQSIINTSTKATSELLNGLPNANPNDSDPLKLF